MEKGKEWFYMKKILSLVLILVTLCSIGISSSAFFGSGAAVVASDVNLIKTGLIKTQQ